MSLFEALNAFALAIGWGIILLVPAYGIRTFIRKRRGKKEQG